jgi:tetratricopeptide (TPR) repeat protein
MAAQGNNDRARTLWNQALANPRINYLHDDVKNMLSELDKAPPTGAGPSDVAAIYGSNPEARDAVRKSLEAVKNPSVADLFYLGEAWLMSNKPKQALKAYNGAIEREAARWDAGYQMLACTRAGEIAGSQGEYKAASKFYEQAGKFWQKEFLYDWVMAARQRYFDRLDQGKESTLPTLLLSTSTP